MSLTVPASHTNVKITLDAHCVLKDYDLKNNCSDSTLYFSKSEICLRRWLTFFKLGTYKELSLDQGLFWGVAVFFRWNLTTLIFLFFLKIAFSFISKNCVQEKYKWNMTLDSYIVCKLNFIQQRSEKGMSARNQMMTFV